MKKYKVNTILKITKEIIIWFFEKYAYDYWIDKQLELSDKEEMEKYEVDTIEKLREIQIDISNQRLEDNYNAGYKDGSARYFKDN